MRRESWYRDEEDEDARWTWETISEHGFWAVVDSQQTPYAAHRGECLSIEHPYRGEILLCGDWAHVRGDGCMAARSDREQCARPTLTGVPFCEFHFGTAWRAMRAFVNHDRVDHLGRMVEISRDRYYTEHGMDVAMVRDAKRQLLVSDERVYFFAAGNAVKIGRSINPEKRVRTLAGTKAPDGIDVRSGSLLGTVPGSCHVESELHRRFAYCRLVGEWFDLEEICEDIAELIADAELARTEAAA